MSGEWSPNFHPRRATYILATLKIITGSVLVALGALAFIQNASYGNTAAGLWGGIIVVISGVLGVFTVRMNGAKAYVFSFFVTCVLALIADVLITIYGATGLARDSGFPGGFVLDDESGELIPVSLVNLPAREKAMVINLLLIVFGVFEILFTLPCFIICLRDVCHCYYPSSASSIGPGSGREYLLPGNAHKVYERAQRRSHQDWLQSWLRQQHHPSHIFYSGASGIPYTKVAPTFYHPPAPQHTPMSRATPPYVFIPSDQSHRSSTRQRTNPHSPIHSSISGGPKSPRNFTPQRAPSGLRSSGRQSTLIPAGPPTFTPVELIYFAAPPPASSYHAPSSNLTHVPTLVPIHAAPASAPTQPILQPPPQATWFYGNNQEEYEAYLEGRQLARVPRRSAGHYQTLANPYDPYSSSMASSKRRKRGRSREAEHPDYSQVRRGRKKQKKAKGPTDSDLDKTYTGLDRELAEVKKELRA